MQGIRQGGDHSSTTNVVGNKNKPGQSLWNHVVLITQGS